MLDLPLPFPQIEICWTPLLLNKFPVYYPIIFVSGTALCQNATFLKSYPISTGSQLLTLLATHNVADFWSLRLSIAVQECMQVITAP